MDIRDIFESIESLSFASLVVITGGEPFRQNINPLCGMLSESKTVQVETNGVNFPSQAPRADIVCSPKTPVVHSDIWNYCEHVKYVVSHKNVCNVDGLPLRSVGSQYGPPARPPRGWKGTIWIQPLDEGDEYDNRMNRQSAVASCMSFGYRLSLQTHKIIGVE